MKIKTFITLALLLPLAGSLSVRAQVNYAVSGSTAYVTNSPNVSGNVAIASTYNGYPVTSIGVGAFDGCVTLTSVTIPTGVTSIGDDAFYDCLGLTNAPIPNSVTSIAGGAFQFCSGLTSVTIPASVTSIGDYAFDRCTSLTNVAIPASVTSIGLGPFAACIILTNITVSASNPDYSSTNGALFNKAQTTLIQFPGGLGGSYAIPATVTNIGQTAFDNCFSLTSVTIPPGVTSIGFEAFIGCAGLTNAAIPATVTNIGGYAFFECSGLTGMTIPAGVTSIGDGAFAICTSLTNIAVSASNPDYSGTNGVLFDKAQMTLIQFPGGLGGNYTVPAGVTSIGDYAFDASSSLTSVTISASVASIGGEAFEECTTLTNLTFQGNAPTLGGADVFYYPAASATVYYYPYTSGWSSTYGGLPAVELTLPYAFTFTTNNGAITITGITGSPTNVSVPATINGYPVTAIGPDAFYGAATMTNISIPNSVTSIGDFAFDRCSGLTGITFPPSLVSIGIDVFKFCTGLTTVTIPATLTTISEGVFDGCSGLTNIGVVAANPNYASVGGVLFDKSLDTLLQCPGGLAGSYTISNSVTSIGADAFAYCSGLKSVIIPNGVTSLGTYAFYGCTGLTNVTIPNGVTSIGDYAFETCSGLKGIYCQGSAPALGGTDVFTSVNAAAAVYYLAGTSGWGATYGGLPTVLLGGTYNQISRPVLTGGNVQLSFIGNYGIKYALDRSFTLSPANWVPQITNSAGPGGVLVFTNTPNPATNNYWRIRAIP